MSNLIKIRPIGAGLFERTDRRTDGRTDEAVTFRKFAKAPKSMLLFISIMSQLLIYFNYKNILILTKQFYFPIISNLADNELIFLLYSQFFATNILFLPLLFVSSLPQRVKQGKLISFFPYNPSSL
jgi:hypothetical protein